MNKAALAENIAQKTGLNKRDVEDVLEAFEKTVMQELKQGHEVTLTGFGTFSSRVRSSRMGVNPQHPTEKMQIPEVMVPKFKSGKALKDYLKAPVQ